MPKVRLTLRPALQLLMLFAVFAGGQRAFGQSQSDACKSLPPLKDTDFVTIADIRGQLQNEIPTIQNRIGELESKIRNGSVARAEKDLRRRTLR